MFDLKAATKKLLDGCVIPSTTGIKLFTPDGQGNYKAVWARDFAYMVEYAGKLISIENIKENLEYLLEGAAPNGWIPDRVEEDKTARYTAGGGDFPANPNLDNGCFIILAVDTYLNLIEPEEASSFFTKWCDTLCRGIDCLPINRDGIIENISTPPHSPYGFTDCICKTGLLAMETLLLWRALNCLYKRLPQNNIRKNTYFQYIKNIENSFVNIFTSPEGMFYAATGTCKQIDIWATCYAVSIGFPLSDFQKNQIADWLLKNYDSIVYCGQIRHLPANTYWEATFIDVPKNTYQNGAFWATATGWFFDAIASFNASKACSLIDDLLQYFKNVGIYECVGPGYKKLDTYVASATNVYGIYEKYLQLKSNLNK